MNRTSSVVIVGIFIGLWFSPCLSAGFIDVARAQEPGAGVPGGVGSTEAPTGIAISFRDWAKKYGDVADAVELFNNNDTGGAMQRLRIAADKYPDLPPAELIIADLLSDSNQRTRVIEALDTAAVNHPDDPETYMLLGNLAFQENRNTDARLAYEKAGALMKSWRGDAIRRNRLELRLSAGLASLAERFNAWEDALENLKRWVELDDKNAYARVRYARALFRTNRGKDAYKELQKARSQNDEILPPKILIAQFYLETGKPQLAEKWLKSAEKEHADDFATRLVLAKFYWKNGQFANAKLHVKAAIEMQPEDSDAIIMAGQLAHYDHDYNAAIEHFDNVHKNEPDDVNARIHLVFALADDGEPGRLKRAVEVATSTATRTPNNAEVLTALAYVLYRAGKKEEAATRLQMATGAPRSANMNYVFAFVLSQEGREDEALKFLKEGLRDTELFVFRRNAEKLYGSLTRVASKDDE